MRFVLIFCVLSTFSLFQYKCAIKGMFSSFTEQNNLECQMQLSWSNRRSVLDCSRNCQAGCSGFIYNETSRMCGLCVGNLSSTTEAVYNLYRKVTTSYIQRYEVMSQLQYNWTDALDFCNTHNNGLATVADDFEYLAMVRAIDASGVLGQLWLGGTHSGGDISSGWNWKHRDGTLETITWSKWTSGNPSGNGQCIQVRFEYLWDDSECFKNKTFICNA